MNLILEASVFGIAWQNPSARTGVYQVALNYLYHLNQNSDIQLYFDISERPEVYSGLLEFKKANPEFKDIPVIGSVLGRFKGEVDTLRNHTSMIARVSGKLVGRVMPVVSRIPVSYPANSIYHSFFWPLPKNRSEKVASYTITIHDLWSGNDREEAFFNQLLGSIQNNDHVICVSEATCRDFYSRKPNFPKAQVQVIHNGVAAFYLMHSLDVKEKEQLKSKFNLQGCAVFLSVSTVHERKNPRNLLKAFVDFVAETGEKNARLVLVGECTENIRSELRKLAGYESVKDSILFTGFVSEKELKAWYGIANCFVYPSLHEGFGIPVLEAMAVGVPVITSNTSSLPEVAGNAALLVDPTNPMEITKAMREVLFNAQTRSELIRKGNARAKEFSWDKSAGLLVKVFQALDAKKFSAISSPG